MAFYITRIILLFILFKKITFSFLGKKNIYLIVLDFYRVVKTVVAIKVVMTLPLCIQQLHLLRFTITDCSGSESKNMKKNTIFI